MKILVDAFGGDNAPGEIVAGAVAALEADDLAAYEVDCWEQDHAAGSFAALTGATLAPFTMETKLRRIIRPVAELFSGWNWQPKTLPRQATHGKLRT